MTPARVVLVDDHEDCLEGFSITLGERYAVFAYRSAAEAVQAIPAVEPDVLILDIGMHPVDGVQCLKMIRAMPGCRDIPALALTGFGRDVERQRFLDAGFQAVVVKPVLELGELMAVIDGLVNVHASPAAELDVGARMTASRPNGGGATDQREGP